MSDVLMCKDCGVTNRNYKMVMVNDKLWGEICDEWSDTICSDCMQIRMGREITIKDFKESSVGLNMIPCNASWLERNKNDNQR